MAITRLTKVSCLKGLSIPPSVPFWGSDSETKISTYKKYTNIWRAWNNISIIFSELKIGYEAFSRVLESKIWYRFRSYSALSNLVKKIHLILRRKSYFDPKTYFWNKNLWRKILFDTKILFWHKNLILAQKSYFDTKILFFEQKFYIIKFYFWQKFIFSKKSLI